MQVLHWSGNSPDL